MRISRFLIPILLVALAFGPGASRPVYGQTAGGSNATGAINTLPDLSLYAPLDSPIFTTNITAPIVIGGSGTGDDLLLQSTSHGTKGLVGVGSLTDGLIYDGANKRVSIGSPENAVIVNTTTIGSQFSTHTEGATDLLDYTLHRHSDTAAFAPLLGFVRSRGSEASETAVVDNDILGRIDFFGHDGTDFERAGQIDCEIDGTVGSDQMGGALIFSTTLDGANAVTEHLRITNTGKHIITATNDTGLHVDSNTTDTTAILIFENTGGSAHLFRSDATPEGSIAAINNGDLCVDTTGGHLYIKASGGASNTGWLELSESSTDFAEMVLHDNSTATAINSQNKEHAGRIIGTGDLQNWTFTAGTTGSIANTADNGGTLRITDVGHGLITGDIVAITGLATAAQNDVTVITRIDDDTFDCDDISFVTGSETGIWDQGSYLTAGTDAIGKYFLSLSSSVSSASANQTFEWHIYINATRQDEGAIRRKFSSTDIGNISSSGILTIADGDRVWVAISNFTSTANLTHLHASMSLHRL